MSVVFPSFRKIEVKVQFYGKEAIAGKERNRAFSSYRLCWPLSFALVSLQRFLEK